MRRFLAALTLVVAASQAAPGQSPQSPAGAPGGPETTPAYASLVMRKAAAEAELADLLGKFKARHPIVESKQFELRAIGLEMSRMLVTGKARAHKLTDAYGQLVLRRVALRVELYDLRSRFTPRHPDVKKVEVEAAALDREIEGILR